MSWWIVLARECPVAATTTTVPPPTAFEDVRTRATQIDAALARAKTTSREREVDGGGGGGPLRLYVCANPFALVDSLNRDGATTRYCAVATAGGFTHAWMAERFSEAWTADGRTMAAGARLAVDSCCSFYVDLDAATARSMR